MDFASLDPAVPTLAEERLYMSILPNQKARISPWPLEKRFCMYAYAAIHVHRFETLDGVEQQHIALSFDPSTWDPNNQAISDVYWGPSIHSVLEQWQMAYCNPSFPQNAKDWEERKLFYSSMRIRIVDFASYCGLDTRKNRLWQSPSIRKQRAIASFLESIADDESA